MKYVPRTKKYIFFACLISLLAILGFPAEAQEGCSIKVILDGYTHDTLWFGKTYGKREVPEFFGLRQDDGSYLLETKDPLPEGMYAIIYRSRPRSKSFDSYQCWLVDGQRKFAFTGKLRRLDKTTIAGSPENEVLYRYNKVFKTLEGDLRKKIERWRYLQNEETFRARVEAEETLHHFQKNFIKLNPETKTAELIEETLLPIPPKVVQMSRWESEAEARWLWQKLHYFDNMDIGKDDFMRKLQWLGHVDFYILHLPPPSPDTTIALVDEIFGRLESNPSAYQYYNKYLTNSFVRMSQFRLDEVFVHLARNYVETGKATWPREEHKRKVIADAKRMEKVFQGEKAADITLYDQQNTPVKLSEISAPYTLAVFWMPDCSHCKKELPHVMEVYEKYKEKGLKVLSVCGKFGDDTPECWKFAEDFSFPSDWFTVVDPQRRSNIGNRFNLMTFPRLFVLDKDKNIAFKRAGVIETWQLEAVLEGLEW